MPGRPCPVAGADVVMNEDSPRYNLRKDFVNVSGEGCRAAAAALQCIAVAAEHLRVTGRAGARP